MKCRTLLLPVILALTSCTHRPAPTVTTPTVTTPTPPPADEPGVAEARQRSTTQPLLTTFSHPTHEARGTWIVSKEMLLPDPDLNALLDRLQAAHLNTLLLNTYFRGTVSYPDSKLLPQFKDFQGKPDPVQKFLTAAAKRNMSVHLWMEYGFYAYFTPDASKDPSKGRFLDEHPELLSVNSIGDTYIHRPFGDFYSLCPSNPLSHQLLADLFTEAAVKYPAIKGINLDRIRYADDDYCYCPYCRTHFTQDTGIPLPPPGPQTKPFPPGSPHHTAFLNWKRERTAAAVALISKQLRAARPDLTLTSYVVGPAEMNSKAQSWDLWISRGHLDAVAVSMYGADITPATTAALQLLNNDPTKLLSALNAEMPTPTLLSNIESSRTYSPRGQFLWHLGTLPDDLDALEKGPYAAPAQTTLK